MAAPGGKGGGKANSKATPKGSSSGGRTDTKGVANPQGKAAGSGKKNNRDIDRNPLLGITLEPEVACSLAVKPPTIHSATVVLVLDEEKTSSDPSRGNAETGDIATQLRVSLENLKNAHGRPQTAQNDEPSAGEQGSTPSAGDTSSDCAEALPEIVLITLEDVFEYGRAKSLLIQDAKAKLGSEMKEEDFARSLAQARAEYLSAVERRRLNILQKDALEQSLSKECESPQPSVSLGEAPSLSGGNRRTTEENRTPLKESLASDTGAVPRNLQLGETHVSGQPRGDEERTDEERDAVVDQIDVLFVLLEVPWSPELCAALSEKRLAVDLILFLTPKSVTELREHSSFDRLPTDLHLFYQTINQAPPGSEFSRTAMETIPNIRQQESLAQPWSLIARKSLQVMQEKAAFSAFLSQTRRVEAAKFLEPTLGLPGDAFLRAKAGPSVAGLGSGRRGGKKEEEQELSTHDDDKKKKKKKTSGKKEQDALDRDRSSAHSGDVGIRGGDPGKPLPSLSENRLVYDALFSSIAAEHQDSALFLHCVMEQVQENVTSQISAAVPDGEGGRPEGPSETAGKNTAAKETRPQGLNSLNHTAFVAYRDRAQRRLKGQKLEEGKESLEDISGELYGSVRVLRGSLSREVSALAVPPSKRVAVLCRVYPFFPELPPKQTDHLLLLLEFEFLLKSLFPNASTPSLSVSRTFHEQLTPPQLIDTLSETLRTPGMYIAQRYVPRSDTLLLALYHRPRPGCVLSHEWESLEMVPVPSLYEFLSFHRLSRDTEEYQTPTCLADLDRERHGNLRLLEQTLMPHDDSVISVATGTSGAGRLFPFPNLEKLEFEERLEQQQETEKLKRPRLRKHAEETDACTEVRREPRFCPEPLHASRCVSVTRPSTSSTFFLREDQAFAEACEELRVFLEAGVQASLALLAAPQGASQPGKEAAGKDREKEKTGLVSSSRQEPEESQKGPVVEDVDLARKNIFWLETASLASFVSHFEDQTRLHIAAHTVELMDAGRSGRTLLAEEVQNARAAVALTFPTGSVVQVTPDGSIWEGNDAALWKRLKQSYGELYAFSTGRYSERSDVLEEDQPTMQPRVQTKFALSENTLYFGCPEDFEIQRRTFPDGRVLRWLLSGRIETFFPDGTVAFRNPSPEEFSLRLSSSHQPPARHLASLRHFVDATLDTLPLDEELPLSPEAAHEAFANGRKDQGIPGHWLFCRPDGSRVGRFKVADDEILFAQSKQGHGGNFDKSLPLDEAARGQEFSSSLARLNASLARHSQTRRAESEWREYELSTLKQAVYPDFQSDTQVVLREDNAVRIDWMHPTEVTPSARKKSVAVHPDGTRIHVEGGPYSEVIKIENENFCHVRIARPPTGTTGTEAAEGEDLETAGLPCQSAILVQAADGTRISISFSERAGQDNERTTQATSITVTRKLEWTVTVREDLQVNVEWTAEHGAPSEKRLRTYSCCLRRKEITTTGDTGDTFVINSEGEVAVRQAAGEETLSVQRPSPGFASPLSTLLFRQAASEEKTNGGERIEDSPEHLSTLGSLRLYAVSCETGEAEEILDRMEVKSFFEQCEADPKSMIAPVRTLKHPYEGCKCHAVFTSASSSPPVLPLTPLPIEQHAQPSTCRENAENTETAFTAFRTFLEYPEVEPGQWRDFQERYFRYLQWEAAKAKHYIPYLVSPEVADFFLSEEKLSAGRPEKTRNCRKRKQQKRKVPPLQSSLPSTVLNLPSDLSVQALEFQALLLRQQITPPRRPEEWLRETLENMKTFASSLDTLQGLCPTASDPDATGLPSAPDSEAQLQRRTELESVSSTPKCFEITEGNFERDPEAAAALSEARDASESNERFFLRMESPEDSLSRSGSSARRGEVEVRSAKSFQRETGKEESEEAPPASSKLVYLLQNAEARREFLSTAINAVTPVHRHATPWADDDLCPASASSSRDASPCLSIARIQGEDEGETRQTERRETHLSSDKDADKDAVQAFGRQTSSPSRGPCSGGSVERKEGGRGREKLLSASTHQNGTREGRPCRATKGEGRDKAATVKSSIYNVYGKPRAKHQFSCPDRFISKMIVARKHGERSAEFSPNEKYQTVEAPVDRKIKTASMCPFTQPKASQVRSPKEQPQRLVEVFPSHLDFGVCKVGERMRLGTRVRNIDSDVCRFSVALEHTGPEEAFEIQLFYTAGRVAPGLCLEIIADLVASSPGPISAAIIVTHKAHLIRVPITAQAV